jgi:hypothetical protein
MIVLDSPLPLAIAAMISRVSGLIWAVKRRARPRSSHSGALARPSFGHSMGFDPGHRARGSTAAFANGRIAGNDWSWWSLCENAILRDGVDRRARMIKPALRRSALSSRSGRWRA